ncbi:hypothetical protein TNCV_2929801 [Trichonephila clavipes]|nr:hypothetical protein TNCV_2929801 [Trichonephila clavipes]
MQFVAYGLDGHSFTCSWRQPASDVMCCGERVSNSQLANTSFVRSDEHLCTPLPLHCALGTSGISSVTQRWTTLTLRPTRITIVSNDKLSSWSLIIRYLPRVVN